MLTLSYELRVPDNALSRGESADIAAEEMHAAMEDSVHVMQAAVLPHVPVDRGFLRAGVQTDITGARADLTGRVFDPIAYAAPVEHGRRPGSFPPLEPIRAWVIRKLGVSEHEARSVAFLVARKIAQRGISAVNMFHDAFKANEARVRERFRQAGARIAARLVK